MSKKIKDCIIIGAGVSGMTSAIYLKRMDIDVLLLESEIPGGQINKTDIIENYPGFLQVKGYELSEKIFEQIIKLNVDFKNENVIKINKKKYWEIITNKEKYLSKTVIIATGRKPKKIGLKDEEKFNNKGISYCSVCDGPLYKNKKVAVIGSGDSAVSSAIYLSNICEKVYLIVRKDKLKAQKYLIDRINSKIEVLFNKNVTKLIGNDYLESIELNEEDKVELSAMFIYIGSVPNSNFIDIKKDNDYIIVDENMETSAENVYAVGDVTKKAVYQITTAVSDATIAAINCIKKIN